MTNTVTFPVNVGGDGSTVTDDSNATTGLGNGGFRTRLLPMFTNMINIANANLTALSTQTAAATTQAGNAAASATAAAASATAAANSAATAVSAPGTNATSTTSLTIGTGGQSLTIQTGKSLVVGMFVTIASTASPANVMYGSVTAYNSGTGALTVNVVDTLGSGTFSAWTVAISGAPGAFAGTAAGAIDEVKAANIASAATVNLETATGNLVHITGTTGITAVTLNSGAERTVVFDGVLTLTNSSSLILPGGANITTTVGDVMRVRGDGAGVARVVSYVPSGGVLGKAGDTATGKMHFTATDSKSTALGSVSGTINIDCQAAQSYSLTPTGTVTFAFINPPGAGQSQVILLKITNGGAQTLNFPAGTKYPGGSLGSLTSSGVDWLGVAYDADLSAWVVFVLGKAVA